MSASREEENGLRRKAKLLMGLSNMLARSEISMYSIRNMEPFYLCKLLIFMNYSRIVI
jgi:hypothetical protein